MIDLIFPVHAPNFGLLVNQPDWAESYEGALPRAIKSLEVQHRIIISAEGSLRNELAIVQAALEEHGAPWRIIHEDRVHGYEKAVWRAFDQLVHPIYVVLPPWLWIDDVKWFGKLQRVFEVDGRAQIASTLNTRTVSATLPPHRLAGGKGPSWDAIHVVRRGAGFELETKEWGRSIDARGGSRWEHPGVVLAPQPHEDHDSSDSRKRSVAGKSRSR